jgi:uncharacterized membrane protein YgcG
MKKLQILLFAFALTVIFGGGNTLAAAESIDNGYQEKIVGYAVNMTLNDNGTLAVSEKIDYDFGNNQKHGIYRYIPSVYKGRLGNPKQRIYDLKITDTSGSKVESTTESSDYYVNVIIGNPDKLISGINTYNISYQVNNVINSETGKDRFLWDAVGTGWNVPIANIYLKLNLSQKVSDSVSGLGCYIGTVGTKGDCTLSRENGSITLVKKSLGTHNGITIDSSFTAGTFSAPSSLEVFFWEQPWYYALPIIALFIYITIWIRKARFAKGRGTIVPIYDAPKELPPTESSILLDDHVHKNSLAAEIIFLATKGYIKIRRIEKEGMKLPFAKDDYELIKVKQPDSNLSDNEQLLFSALFTTAKVVDISKADIKELFSFSKQDKTTPISAVKLSEISPDFVTQNYMAHNAAYKYVTKSGYYTVNPIISKSIFAAVGVVVMIFFGILSVFMLAGPLQIVTMISPGIIGLIFAFVLPEKTRLGMLAKENLLGLKMYIRAAEIDRIKFHNAPKKDPQKFEELLPYAIIFGLEKEWGKQFDGILKDSPGWYDGNMGTFSAIALVNGLDGFSTVMTQAITQASVEAGASAGGFSGGGGGGGGGGSW